MNLKKTFGSIALLLAAIIWGFAFVAQTSGAETIPTFTFNFLRSYIAFVFLGIFIAIASLKKPYMLPKTKETKKSLIIGGICCGIALFVATSFQQYGISLYPENAGASGRSGFITALYVVLVPCFSAIIFRRKIHPLVWVGVFIAVGGMYLLCFGGGFSRLYI
ncbi:MAG: DMT family transporter, partial [Clostridia bacterium]|nr:DMT family transporter [Clostridia bacterium]